MTVTTLTTVIKSPAATFRRWLAHCMPYFLLELMHTKVSSTHTTLTTLPMAVNSTTAVALFHETERNPTKPSNYCRQMCDKNASNSNKSIPLSMVMRMDIVGNV